MKPALAIFVGVLGIAFTWFGVFFLGDKLLDYTVEKHNALGAGLWGGGAILLFALLIGGMLLSVALVGCIWK